MLKTAQERVRENIAQKHTQLDLSNLQLTQLPPEIAKCEHLKDLRLNGNQLGELPGTIGNLRQLQSLDLSRNKLDKLPHALGLLVNLQTLLLADNLLVNTPRGLRQLKHLKELDISGNKVQALPAYLPELSDLENLNIALNQLQRLPDTIGRLPNLQVLNISGNYLNSLPAAIGNLQKLRILDASNNQINFLTPDICRLTQLEQLNLRQNLLSGLPFDFVSLTALKNDPATRAKGLDLAENRLKIPQEILSEQQPADIIRYVLDLQKSRQNKPLHEAKLIFIGSGNVGKTSLINMLITGQFNPDQQKTDGIDIKHWHVVRGTDRVKLNIWDFGGQEIMHATHRFFMTARSAYVLVINPRTEDSYGDTELDYWLKLIRSYAGEVPVVVVMNKCDVHRVDIPKGELKDKYANIIGFVETSCTESRGLDELREQIKVAINRLEHLDDLLPRSYFMVKNRLEIQNDDYISYEEYAKVCYQIDPEFEPESIQTLMQLLHDLGVMLNFKDETGLLQMQVLNPEWVTSGVYQIIASERLLQKKGILKTNEIARILDNRKYPTAKERIYIMELMRRFELCYQVPDMPDTYFVPGAFPKDRPATPLWQYTPADGLLRFQYQYDVLPGSIMSRFIVKIHDYVCDHAYWRNGVVLEKGQAAAFVHADLEERIIYIEVAALPRGTKSQQRDLLAFVRGHFDTIHHKLHKISVKGFIPVDEPGRVVLDYDEVMLFIKAEVYERPVVGMEKKVNLLQLIGDYLPEAPPTSATLQTTGAVPVSAENKPQKWYQKLWVILLGLLALLSAIAQIYEALFK